MKINLLDLFSGIGGFHLGLERAGFKVNAFNSEIDKHAIDVYKNNFKNSTYVGSVTDVRGRDLPRIDAITFGSPCQDFSIAGKGKGMGGERSSLILEAIRIIEECRPRFFIWENVKGTFSSNSGEDFAAILQAFANLGDYRIEWQLLNTKWFLPQNRERVYLVGYLRGKPGRDIYPIGEISREAKGSKGYEGVASQGVGAYIAKRKLNQEEKDIIIKANTSKGYETLGEGDSLNYSQPNSKTRRGRVGKGEANMLDTGVQQAVYKDTIRRLTPIECERLQGFPDNWTKYGTKEEIRESQRYKMCGNAVTVDVVKAVGERLRYVLGR